MKNALQEQLLKAGLATEEQLTRATSPKRKPPRKQGKGAGGSANRQRQKGARKPGNQSSDLARAYAARQQAEREEAARKKRLKAQRKANRAKIRQLTLDNCLNVDDAELPFQFMVGTNIKNIYVTPDQRKQLLEGQLRITFQDGRRCLISTDIAAKIHELDPEKLIINPTEVEETIDEAYAEFKVPDDLNW